jgi:peroxiredoxin
MVIFKRVLFLSGLVALLQAGPSIAADPLIIGDLDGVQREPLANSGQKAVVFFFLLQDCPICNAYSVEIGRIVEEYSARKIAFYAVQIDPDLSPADARKHAKDYGIKCPVLLDRKHELVAVAKVAITPEAAVFAADGKLVYHGRIDDTYVDFGKRREKATVRDLRAALDAVLEGRPVPQPVTSAVGCFIGGKK